LEPVAVLLSEIRQQVELFESSLPTRLDAMTVSPISKLPFKVLLCRETLIWRMTELSRDALESFEKNNLVSAIVLTRAATETSTALHFLCAKVETVVESGVIGDIDDYLMKLTMGTATRREETDSNANVPVLPRPVKVGAFIEQMDEEIKGVSHHYGILSEYAHPNWAGTAVYCKHNVEDRSTTFGRNVRGESTSNIGVNGLSGALLMFERSYNRISDLMPTFIGLCETGVKRHDTD
jgi:hypothetical protein